MSKDCSPVSPVITSHVSVYGRYEKREVEKNLSVAKGQW